MTVPLVVLAAGAIVAGFVGVPAALGGGNAIEHFLAPSFSVQEGNVPLKTDATQNTPNATTTTPDADHTPAEHGASRGLELGLMLFSVAVALGGMALAWRLYITRPSESAALADRFAGVHRLLSNKYWVDEIYNSTIVAGTMAAGRRLWGFDRRVVDGAVNGSSWITLFGSWMSGLTDRRVVDGIVNALGTRLQGSSYWMRRLQTGLVQNYALMMLFGVFAFVSLYLFVR